MLLVTPAGTAWGQPSQVTELHASDAFALDEFGFSVSIDGDTAVVGAPLNNDAGSDSGSAYIFQQDPLDPDTWVEILILRAADAASLDQFGYSVSISGDFAIVGAKGDDDGGSSSGSAYIFRRDSNGSNQWGQIAKLIASDAAAGDILGWSVSISGNVAIVGAPGDAGDRGAAYIFIPAVGQSGQWEQVAKLRASDGDTIDRFGWSVSISGDTAVIGAYLDSDNGIFAGSAYVFVKPPGGWATTSQYDAKLDPSSQVDFFGTSVAISIDTAVVGSPNDNNKGSAYIFERDAGGDDQWGQTAKLTASDGVSGDEFGFSVSIRGDGVLVGASQDDDAGSASGSAYTFLKPSTGWQNGNEDDKITAAISTRKNHTRIMNLPPSS